MKTLGEKIAELRKERGMTQESLAQTVGVSAQAISKWETNTTMPDVTLLPLLAGVFEVTIDELFAADSKPKKPAYSYEERPSAAYDAILNAMWQDEAEMFADEAKAHIRNNPIQHSGFVSVTEGGVYANRDLALAWLPDAKESLSLLESEKAADFLAALADKNVRAMLRFMVQNPERTFTAAYASSKTGIPEEEAAEALEKLIRYSLSRGQDVDVGADETLRVYQMYGRHKMPLLVYPLLSLAEQMADFQDAWFGFRG